MLNPKYKEVPSTLTSSVWSNCNETELANGGYRIAVGLVFDDTVDRDTVESVTSDLLDTMHRSVAGDEHLATAESLLDTLLVRADPNSRTTKALILWKDHLYFNDEIMPTGAIVSWPIAYWLEESPHEELLRSSLTFICASQRLIGKKRTRDLREFLEHGEYKGANNLSTII